MKTKEQIKPSQKSFDKMSKDELLLFALKGQIEIEKETFNRYVKVLAKHAFTEIGVCGSSVYFEDMFHKEFFNTSNLIRNAKITDAQKTTLNHMHLPFLSVANESELEIQKSNLEYWKSLVSWAKSKLSDLSMDLKIKIVQEGVEKAKLWLDQGVISSKIYAELESMGGKKK